MGKRNSCNENRHANTAFTIFVIDFKYLMVRGTRTRVAPSEPTFKTVGARKSAALDDEESGSDSE
jgi:hypothetical protein